METTTEKFAGAADNTSNCDTPPCPPLAETVHDLDDTLEDQVDLSSAESMIASDPPSFTATTGTAADEHMPQDQRVKTDRHGLLFPPEKTPEPA